MADERPKCRECSKPIEPGVSVAFIEDEWLHAHCWIRLNSQKRGIESRALIRESRESIESSQERIVRTGAIACSVCGEGIESVADLALRGRQATHRTCADGAPPPTPTTSE